jgi:hypothetical protein
MGTRITKDNIDELITSFIDDQNQDRETKEQITTMLADDGVLRKKYRAEVLTRDILRNRLKLVEVPTATYLRVSNSIDSLTFTSANSSQVSRELLETSSFQDYLKNFLTARFTIGSFGIPRYSVAGVFVIAVLFIGILVSRNNHAPINPYIASGSDKNVMVQAVNNFHKILSGEITPEIRSKDSREVTGYLKRKLNFNPFVPALTEFELLGCVSSQFEGENVAHIVYTSGSDIIYIYQTDISSVSQKKLELPEAVNDRMLKDRYYMCDHVDEADCTLLMWYIDNVLCASVSNLPKSNLYNKIVSLK